MNNVIWVYLIGIVLMLLLIVLFLTNILKISLKRFLRSGLFSLWIIVALGTPFLCAELVFNLPWVTHSITVAMSNVAISLIAIVITVLVIYGLIRSI